MATLDTALRTCCTLGSLAMRPCQARTAPTGKQPMSQPLKPVSKHWVIRWFRVLEPQAAVVLAAALAAALAPAPGRATASAPPADPTMTVRTTLFAPMANAHQIVGVEVEVALPPLQPAPGRVTASALLADLTMTARMTMFAATASVRRR